MIIQVTFKSGSQQFFELDDDDAIDLSQSWMNRKVGIRRNSAWSCSAGANLDLDDLSGFQHYITPEMAHKYSSED